MAATNPYRRPNSFVPYNPWANQEEQGAASPIRDDSMFGVNMPKDRINRFGEMPIQDIQGPAQPDPNQNPVNLAEGYAKINANRPNRMAYQQAVEQGAPKIERGKWAKLGAILSASAEGFARRDASAGYNLGMSAYQAPQMRSDEEYERKMKGLGNLANLEESDVNRQIQQLESEHGAFYTGRADKRAQQGETRADKLAESEIKNRALDNIVAIQEDDGNTYLYDKGTKIKQFLGKTSQSSKEREEEGRRTFANNEKVRAYYEHQANITRGEYGLESTRLGVEGRADVARTKATASITAAQTRLRATAATAPDNVAKGIMLDLASAMDQNKADALPPEAADHLWFDDNGTPRAYTPLFHDPAVTDKVQSLIAYSIDKGKNPQNYPSANSRTVGGNSGSVPMIDPEGGTFNARPDEVDALVKKGATVAPSGNTPSTGTQGVNRTTEPSGFKPPAFVPYSESDKTPEPNKFASTANVPIPTKSPSGLMGGEVTDTIPNVNYGRFGETIPNVKFGTPQTEPMPGTFTGPPPVNTTPAINKPTPRVVGQQNRPDFGVNAPPPYSGFAPDAVMSGRMAPRNVPRPPQPPTKPITLPGAGLLGLTNNNAPKLVVPPNVAPPAVTPPTNPITLNPGAMGNVPPRLAIDDKIDSIKKKVEALTPGYELRVISKVRDADEQAELFKQSRTPADGTKLKSQHQTGDAADFKFYDKKGNQVKDPKLLAILGRVAKEEGLIWGGDFKDKDPNHVQIRPAAPRR